MNVIFAIVINRNCYFRYLEQLENEMHLNVPNNNNNNNNNNNSLFENISSLSQKYFFSFRKDILSY